ncbi:MAG TPA: MmgE/PrpD family protein [Burkholderiales bacterium]|jgi:2-methylcitrate dehydratase PrpD|nr:MmgE/PrpD family protein [Burkholderiales bacterium]
MEVTKTLAQFLVDSRYDAIPETVRHEARRSVLNWLGCAIGASRHEGIDIALAALRDFSGPAQATVLGRGDRLDIMHAALLNGISSHMFDFDDTHLKTVIHPSGPVASALLALAEYRPMTGADFLHAFILGVEVECRIGNAVYPSHYDVGWHITGTAGVFGAAAAVGKILGINLQQMTWALGIAATQASGLREMFGTMCKPFHPGRAAQNGMTAAFLASKNFTSSERGIEAPRGFANVLATARNFDEITGRLGQTWEVSLNTYKPFACGIVIHPIIDGCIQLRNEYKLKAADIESIALKVHPLVLELTGKKTPQVGLEGKFSVYHSAAVAIIHGEGGEDVYSDACVRDPQVTALRDKVSAEVDKSVHEDAAHLAIKLKDGRFLTKHVEHAIGSLARPMTDGDLEAKFRKFAKGILLSGETDALIKLCWALDGLKDAGDIARASVPATAAKK